MKLFEKALKVEKEELKALLVCSERELTDNVCEKMNELLNIKMKYFEFYEIVMKEAEARNWNIKQFKNEKNEPVLNLFKRLIRNICKERGIELSNDVLSRLLNVVRNHYTDDAILSAGLYPAEAFFKRDSYDIPEDLGDTNSCFRPGGCNMGSALWLINEWKVYDRAWFIVFHYQSGSREGYGRCWAYKLPNAVYATNFYSRKFEIKEERFRKVIARLIRKLFNLSNQTRFATGKYSPLPIYLNGDGYVIYEPSHWENSDEVLEFMRHLKSRCLWCKNEIEIEDLKKYDEPIYFSSIGERVNGLIVCEHCIYELDNTVECHDCGTLINRDDAYHIDGDLYICEDCFSMGWFYCDKCEEPHRREYAIVTPSGEWLCEYCASKVGAVCLVCGEFCYYDDEENGIQQYEIMKHYWFTDVYICDRCVEKHLYKYHCCQCGREMKYLDVDFRNDERIRDAVRLELCFECYAKKRSEMFNEAFGNGQHPSLFILDPAERTLREILEE